MIKLTIITLKKTLAFGIALGVLGSILTNSVLELNVEAMDPKIELNTYVDPIKDLGIKPLLVTIKFDKDQLADDINNIISETSNIEVKEVKKNSKQLKLIKNKNKKLTTENNTRADEVILGASNISEVEKIAKKFNKKVKNIKKESDVDISTKANKDIEVMDLTPLINDMYPSRETIDNLNREILAEAKFEKEHLKKMKHLKEPKAPTQDLKSMFLEGVKAQADSNTSNEQGTLVIYNRANQGLVFDVPGSNFRSGQELRLWDRWTNHNNAQHFSTFQNDATIRIGTLCLERDKDSYAPGAKIHLHFCNGHNAQKWKTYPDGTIRPLHNHHICLDAQGGLTRGSRIYVHSCHSRDNQSFRMGKNEDFGTTRTYEMSIHATAVTPSRFWRVIQGNFGHAFISVSKNDNITNTFGSNGKNEEAKDKNTDCDSNNRCVNNEYKNGRTNNIHTWNTLNIDGDYEWNNARWDTNYNRRRVKIPKSTYDTIKYMRGWDFNPKFRDYDLVGKHCAAYAKNFWNIYVGHSSNTNKILDNVRDEATSPAHLANSIWVMHNLYNTGY